MAEPSSYLLAKLAAGIGGLFGGLTLMTYIKPRTITDAALRGGISTGTGIIFASPILIYLQMRTDWEMQLMAGGIIGFVSWSLLSMVARLFQKADSNNEDIIDFVRNTKKRTTKSTSRKKRVRNARR